MEGALMETQYRRVGIALALGEEHDAIALGKGLLKELHVQRLAADQPNVAKPIEHLTDNGVETGTLVGHDEQSG